MTNLKSKSISLNQFQLNVLLTQKEKDSYNYLLKNGVYCSICDDICQQGITVNENFLTALNDIKIQGICNKCNGKVIRIVEYGEDPEFNTKANEFRKSIKK